MKVTAEKLAHEYKRLNFEPLMLQFNMLMKESGKSQANIARKTGICAGTIRRWEQRKTRRPNSSTLRMAYKAIGYSLRPVKE